MGIVRFENIEVESIRGSASVGGWESTGAIINDQEEATYCRRAELFHRMEGAGVWDEKERVGMRGFIMPRAVTFDRRQSRTEVTIATSHIFLQNAGLQGIFFSKQGAPANPHQMVDPTLGRIVYHIVHDHTNIGDWVDLSGIDQSGSTAVDVYAVRESQNLWSTIKDIGDNEFYVAYFTRDDRLMYRCHPMFAASLPEPVLTIDTDSILGQPTINYRDWVRPDQAQLYALTDTGATLKAEYPANLGVEGRRHREDHLRCNSQARLNQLAQRLYLFLQRDYNVSVSLPGSCGLAMDLYDRVEMTYAGTARNGVTVNWSQKKFWIEQITVQRTHRFGAVTELTLEEENWTSPYMYTDYT